MGGTPSWPLWTLLTLFRYVSSVSAIPISKLSSRAPFPFSRALEGVHSLRRDFQTHFSDDWWILFALVLCIAILAVYVVLRRWQRSKASTRQGRTDALARDLSSWDPARARRRYWQTRWRSTEATEEGLNENGEAPPPYDPKTTTTTISEVSGEQGPAVPLHVLTRDQVLGKPPDYLEAPIPSAENSRPRAAA